MQVEDDQFELSLAATPADLEAAQELRYRVFVAELGACGEMIDHAAGLEKDRFDPFADHLILRDTARDGAPVIGAYRLMRGPQAQDAGQFYSEDEFDLTPLRASGRSLLELGRSCLDPAYRGGTAMLHLWRGLSDYVARHGIEVMFGVASFPGTDPQAIAGPLSLLYHRHLAPEALRPIARPPGRQEMALSPLAEIDRAAAMRATPALIKAYLRLGGTVGAGAYIDRAFNCIDVCLVLDTAAMSQSHRAIYDRRGRG